MPWEATVTGRHLNFESAVLGEAGLLPAASGGSQFLAILSAIC